MLPAAEAEEEVVALLAGGGGVRRAARLRASSTYNDWQQIREHG